MAVSSMTGFARADGGVGGVRWTWEVKSVNGRSLEVRCRLPQRMEWLEPVAREAVAKRFRRGHVGVALTLDRVEAPVEMRLNRPLLDRLLAVAAEIARESDAAPPRIDGLLAIRGVVEIVEPEEDEAARAARETALVESLGSALDALGEARRREGERLEALLRGQVDEIAALADRAANAAALSPEALKARLREKLALLLDETPPLPEERLAQEAAALALKADTREEVDRLCAHVGAARELLAAAAVGRRLDFLSQEFNREANTLCAKSGDLELTRIGLDLKAVIDQFREQIQNVE